MTYNYSPVYAVPAQVAQLYEAKLFAPAKPRITKVRWFKCRVKDCKSSGPVGSRVAYNCKDSGQMGAHIRNAHPETWAATVTASARRCG
jgi:hypothetical protein